MTPRRKKRRAPEDRGRESREPADACPRRRGAPGAGRGRRNRCRSPGVRPPPLRKRLVTTLRALSAAIYQDVARACERQKHSPLTWEPRAGLAGLGGPLYAALQTVYTMANQAAYGFPAESWLVPGPPPGPGAPLGVEGKPGGPPLPGARARLPELRPARARPQSRARSSGGENKTLLRPRGSPKPSGVCFRHSVSVSDRTPGGPRKGTRNMHSEWGDAEV